MAKFNYTISEYETDRVYLKVDDTFDISVLRREEGLNIDVYGGEDYMDLWGTLALDNPETMEA